MVVYPWDQKTDLGHGWLRSLKLKLLVLTLVVLGLASSLLGIVLYRSLLRESEKATLELANSITFGVEGLMLARDPQRIQGDLESLAASSDEIDNILILDNNSVVAYAANPSDVGRAFNRAAAPSCSVCHADPRHAPVRHSVVQRSDGGAFGIQRIVQPLWNKPTCQVCHGAERATTGTILIDRSLKGTFQWIAAAELALVLATLVGLAILIPSFSRGLNRYIREIIRQDRATHALYVLVERLSRTIDVVELNQVIPAVLGESLEAEEVDVISTRRGGGFRRFTWSRKTGDLERTAIETDSALHAAAREWATGALSDIRLRRDGAEIHLPIALNGEPTVLLVVRNLAEPRDSEWLWFAKIIAGHIGVAFQNARLYTMAITDGLTGAYLRRHFDYCILNLVTKCESEGKGFSLLIMDVDDFKAINDRFGHPHGDTVLVEVVRCVQECIRTTDLVFRYGGDEFAVLLPETDLQAGVSVANRICNAVSEFEFENPLLRASLCIGTAACPDHGRTPQDVIKAADSALYAAKKRGKNRVEICSAEADVRVPH